MRNDILDGDNAILENVLFESYLNICLDYFQLHVLKKNCKVKRITEKCPHHVHDPYPRLHSTSSACSYC